MNVSFCDHPVIFHQISHHVFILSVELPAIFLLMYYLFLYLFLTHSFLWNLSPSEWEQGSWLSCPPLNHQCVKETSTRLSINAFWGNDWWNVWRAHLILGWISPEKTLEIQIYTSDFSVEGKVLRLLRLGLL